MPDAADIRVLIYSSIHCGGGSTWGQSERSFPLLIWSSSLADLQSLEFSLGHFFTNFLDLGEEFGAVLVGG